MQTSVLSLIHQHISRASLMMACIFTFSLFGPALQVWAIESNFYDGPGGFQQNHKIERLAEARYNIESRESQNMNQVVGMALGGAVGGGLVLALGLAASPLLAVTAVVGSVLAGGFVGDKFGETASDTISRATGSNNMMTWIGGIAGAAAGFMIPGGSVIGASIGAALGGVAGNALGKAKDNMDLPSMVMQGGLERMGGGFMGPNGAMMDPMTARASMLYGAGNGMYSPGWYGPNGGLRSNLDPSVSAYGDPNMPLDFRTHYVWHDDNGDLAYPGWQNDLYRADGSARLERTVPQWSLNGENSSVFYGGGASNRSAGLSRSSGGSIDNPSWDGPSRPRSNSSDGDVYSTYTTSDGETFNPDYQSGSRDSLQALQARYRSAVDELGTLTQMNAPEKQRRDAHREVQRLEKLLSQALGR